MPLQRNLLARDPVDKVPAVLTQETIEAHVGASSDREQRFVDVCDLEGAPLADQAPNGHHLAASLYEVRDVATVGDIVLDTLAGQLVLQYADAWTMGPRHHRNTRSRDDSHFDLYPLLGLVDYTDRVLPDRKQRADSLKGAKRLGGVLLVFDMQRVPNA